MMRQMDLIERVQRYKPDADEDLLNRAYVYAMQKHGDQTRASGDPYFSHPLEVAAILTDMHLDERTIAVALLHDTIEDTSATRKEIEDLFGSDTASLVEGLTKLKKLDLVSKKAVQAENLRKLLLAISDDVRVLLVKLADRLHNMRTLEHMRPDKQARIAQETLDIYAPLAGRMGIQDIRDELENLSFKYVNPEGYALVTKRLKEVAETNAGLAEDVTSTLRGLLADNGIHTRVTSRTKRPYSVFRKMEAKGLAFEQLSDIYAFRVLVDTVDECYRALGIVHCKWKMVPGRFKDYISIPKQNDYQSIHTTIVGPSKQRVELQIRSHVMHEIAEFGVAAHAIYKDAGTSSKAAFKDTSAYAWLRHTIEALTEGDVGEEFLEHTKLELFQDQVFCFTPKGRLIALPKGAIPVDFAYAVHTAIGNSCIGAKINGRTVPLVTRLENGDEVEIVTDQNAEPPAAWETLVATGKARAAIRRATRAAVRRQYAGLGHRILERAFERAGKPFSRDLLAKGVQRLAMSDVDDALAAVGRGEVPPINVIKAVHPELEKEQKLAESQLQALDEGWFHVSSGHGLMFRFPEDAMVPADGGQDREALAEQRTAPMLSRAGQLEVKFTSSGAVPGDRIVGIATPGEGITIYPIHANALANFDHEPERWIDVRWDINPKERSRFPAQIVATALNEPGSLAIIAKIIAAHDANIHTLSMVQTAPDFTEMIFDLEVWDLKHLSRLLQELRDSEAVSSVERVTN
ncbi:MAG: bifunctional (p)ppGpp synthetase/guanosine-3',5'-bis(diphosphate) 3'-pyrophosphohydrolase [Pseudomonadota bacterium]